MNVLKHTVCRSLLKLLKSKLKHNVSYLYEYLTNSWLDCFVYTSTFICVNLFSVNVLTFFICHLLYLTRKSPEIRREGDLTKIDRHVLDIWKAYQGLV